MVEVVVVGISVEIAKSHAIQLGIGQRVNDMRLESLNSLEKWY